MACLLVFVKYICTHHEKWADWSLETNPYNTRANGSLCQNIFSKLAREKNANSRCWVQGFSLLINLRVVAGYPLSSFPYSFVVAVVKLGESKDVESHCLTVVESFVAESPRIPASHFYSSIAFVPCFSFLDFLHDN